jgi:hypothetical protein
VAEPTAAGLGTVFDRSTCGRKDGKSLWAATATRCTRLAARGPPPGADADGRAGAAVTTDEHAAALPELSDEQIDVLRRFGRGRTVGAGDILYRQQDASFALLVILEGRVTVIDDFGGAHERAVVELEGVGVYYAATQEEASRCAGAAVAVGGGNSAGQAALFPAGRTRRVYLLARRGDLAPTMSRYLIDQIGRRPGIEILSRAEVLAMQGEGELQGLTVAGRRDSSRRELDPAPCSCSSAPTHT